MKKDHCVDVHGGTNRRGASADFLGRSNGAQTKSKATACRVMLNAVVALAVTLAIPRAHAQSKVVPTHCKTDERVVFSCAFKHGKTASLCASADLSKTTGTLQYRYGVVGKKVELVFPNLEERTVARNHPRHWFEWYSSLRGPLSQGRGYSNIANTQWSTTNVPPGNQVTIYLDFSPLDENPAIDFTIQAEAGVGVSFQGAMLLITERVGPQGRGIAEHRCIREKTTEDLFSLKDIIQK